MELKSFGFENLVVYQRSKEFVRLVYRLLKKFPREEQYAICDQLRRAAVSVTSNIAEGMSRSADKEKIHFLNISYGSLMEAFSQLDVAYDLNYITDSDLLEVRTMVVSILKPLAGLKKSISNPSTPENRTPKTEPREPTPENRLPRTEPREPTPEN